MATAERFPPLTAGARVLDQLLRERGLHPGAYALFLVSGEGAVFPSPETGEPIEAASGFVLVPEGAVYHFWMEWDSDQQRPILSEWARELVDASWNGYPEYQRARHRLGLLQE